MAIVVATRNRRETLLGTLARLVSLEAPYAVVVVDNGSTDGTVDAVARAFPSVTVLPLGANRGAAARNEGVARVSQPYVAFADDDSWWAPSALAAAAARFADHPRLGLLAGRVLVGPEERQDATCALMARSPLSRPAGFPGVPVLGFLACAAIVRRDAFLEAGGFHPRFGIGGEEGLLALDLARRGWWLAYADDLVCHHHPSPTRDPAARAAREVRNRLWEAWLRRPVGPALAATADGVVTATRDPAARRGLIAALTGLPWVLRERASIPPGLEQQVRLLDAQGRTPQAGAVVNTDDPPSGVNHQGEPS